MRRFLKQSASGMAAKTTVSKIASQQGEGRDFEDIILKGKAAALSEAGREEALSRVKYERPALGDSPWLFSIPLTPADWDDPWPLCGDL